MAMIESKKLRKVFGTVQAVKHATFSVDKGEVLGFLGPNGAGKTTLMRMLTCFLTPTSGTASIGGHDILSDSIKAREMVGYLAETNPLYGDMTPVSFLNFIGEIRGYRGAELARRVDTVIETCQLKDVALRNIDTLSKGYKRRVGLGLALIHDPTVLILDEPTDGLDPNQKHDVRTLINRMAPDKCIVISTHILEEVEAVCTRAIIIADGEIVVDETPAALKERSRFHGAVRLWVKSPDKSIPKSAFDVINNIDKVEEDQFSDGIQRFMLFPRKGHQISQEVLDLAKARHWQVEEMIIEEGRLDEVFRSITTTGGGRNL